MTDEEIKQVETIVNQKIRDNISLDEQRSIALNEAKALGASALFGEKYGETVRMITFDPNYSRELCGGTHVPATGMIGFFKVVSESAVQAGVRRIEAITGVEALNYIFELADNFKELREVLNNPKSVVSTVVGLLEENSKLKKEVEKGVVEKIKALKDSLIDKVQSIEGVNFLAQEVDLPSAEALKNLSFSLKDQIDNLFLVLGASVNGKPTLSVMVSENLIDQKKLNASTIVRELAKEIQGGGGGQPFYATAGGKNIEGLAKAIERARQLLAK
jgi:alanyl-tRNA synthetase